ncbi:MAG: adenine deaminase, partial [Microbacteriaceae bacterium]|nr:adenine deaminase [Microbacteriaceae bacterium]
MKTLPKVELHIHLEGTLEPELIFELAARNGIQLPYDLDELRRRYEFTDLQSFLDLYYANLSVVLTEHDFADLTRAYLRRARDAGVRHVELFLDPQAHTSRGVPLATCIKGVSEVLKNSKSEFGISSALIATFLRDRPAEEALAVLAELIAMDAPLVGVGLDSAEVGHPPADFVDVFDLARANGLQCVAHAGEEGPPEYVWQALELLGVARVDHGIRSLEDPKLVDYLVSNRIPLTVCPLS